MNRAAKEAYMETLRERYFKGTKKEKGKILNEYCRNTGQERKYVIKKFRYKVKLKRKEERKKRGSPYNGTVINILVKIWEIFDYPCGQRLESILQTEVEHLRLLGEIKCSNEIAQKLMAIKSATIDRRLNHEKEVRKLKNKINRKSSFLLSNVPVKTSADFDRAQLGNMQVDFVESCGTSASGEYINNLSVCDIFSGWWEGEAVMGKGHQRALTALDNCRKRTPFPWLEFHPDNGTNLLNFAVYAYAENEGLEFSRSRPYHKNDNCFIEQKNATHVRRVIGYLRYDSAAELNCLNDLFRNELRLYKNFFQPVIKLVSKKRIGGKIKRKYDKPKTPYHRLVESDQISPEIKMELTAVYLALNPAKLKKTIDQKLNRLYRIHTSKTGRLVVNHSKNLKPLLVSFPSKFHQPLSVS